MVDKDYVCEDWGETTQWTQIRVTVKLEQLDALVSILVDAGRIIAQREAAER